MLTPLRWSRGLPLPCMRRPRPLGNLPPWELAPCRWHSADGGGMRGAPDSSFLGYVLYLGYARAGASASRPARGGCQPVSCGLSCVSSARGGGGDKTRVPGAGTSHTCAVALPKMAPTAFGPEGGSGLARAPTPPPRDPPGHAPTRACFFWRCRTRPFEVSPYHKSGLEGTASALAGSESFLSHPPHACLGGFDGLDGYHG